MKKTKIDIDPYNDILYPKIILEDDELRFELHCFDTDNGLSSNAYKINSIEISGMSPEDLTLSFGNLGHIHIEKPRQVKMFVEAVNEFYEEYLKPMYEAR